MNSKRYKDSYLHFHFLMDTELYRRASASHELSKPIKLMEELLWEMLVSSDFEHVLET